MADLVLGPRGSGRTWRLLEIAARGFAYPVVADYRRASQVSAMAREAGLDVPFPLTHRNLLREEFNVRGVRGFVVDDLDALLAASWELAEGELETPRSAHELLVLRGPRG